jgi:hypothetical protein
VELDWFISSYYEKHCWVVDIYMEPYSKNVSHGCDIGILLIQVAFSVCNLEYREIRHYPPVHLLALFIPAVIMCSKKTTRKSFC